MIRMSMLRNYPVIHLQKQIGLVQSLTMDPARKRVQALIVSGGLKGKRILPATMIQAIGDGYILAKSIQAYKRSMEPVISPFARDSTGCLVGLVTDYAIDERTLEVLAAEMMTGYLPHEQRNRIWMYAYHCTGSSDMIVPASLGSELIFSKEEDN